MKRFLTVSLLLAVFAGPMMAETRLSSIQVEAAYLYNFTRFVTWPASSFATADSPLVVGILGKDPFGRLLDDLAAGERINGRNLVVRRFKRVDEIGDCHVLFIASSEAYHVRQICAELQNHHILTVSDITNFTQEGGIIELVQEKDRIRFRIALHRSRAEHLEISAKLLRPAEVVSAIRSPLRARRLLPVMIERPLLGRARDLLPAVAGVLRWSLPDDLSLSAFLQ
ncbi:MAG: YfiR family protein [Opitutaceae bacterium]